MQLKLDKDDIRVVVRETVREVLAEIQAGGIQADGRLGYSEGEAADLIGVDQHVLRDARRRGEIHAKRVGRSYRYSRDTLLRFLEK